MAGYLRHLSEQSDCATLLRAGNPTSGSRGLKKEELHAVKSDASPSPITLPSSALLQFASMLQPSLMKPEFLESSGRPTV